METQEEWGLALVAPAVLGGGQVVVPFVLRRWCRGRVAYQPRLQHGDGRLSILPAADSMLCAARDARRAAQAHLLALAGLAGNPDQGKLRAVPAGPSFFVSGHPTDHCVSPVAARYPQGWRAELEILPAGSAQPFIVEIGGFRTGGEAAQQAREAALEAALLWQLPDNCDDAGLLILLQRKLALTAIVDLADWAAHLDESGTDRLLVLPQVRSAIALGRAGQLGGLVDLTLPPSPHGSLGQHLQRWGLLARAALPTLQLQIAHLQTPGVPRRFARARAVTGRCA